MVERLKQIWAGFEGTTTRKLTGRGVENIIVPHRADYSEVDYAFLPEDFQTPSEAAFRALREDLKKKGSLFGNKKADTASMSDEGPQPMAERAFGGGELIRGLRSTAMRTTRSDMDYETFLATDAGKAAVKRSKKKRFGIF